MDNEDDMNIEDGEMETAPNTEIGDEGTSLSSSILDLVVDGKATEAREAIYAALYGKVGDRIDALRPEIRSTMVPTDGDEPIDLEADVDDSQE
jgi:hypothetical protein